jgi:hypothetical protein
LEWIAATTSGRIYLFFFFARKFVGGWRWMAVGGNVRSAEVGGGLFIWVVDLLIGCFDFILNLCIFPKLLRC